MNLGLAGRAHYFNERVFHSMRDADYDWMKIRGGQYCLCQTSRIANRILKSLFLLLSLTIRSVNMKHYTLPKNRSIVRCQRGWSIPSHAQYQREAQTSWHAESQMTSACLRSPLRGQVLRPSLSISMKLTKAKGSREQRMEGRSLKNDWAEVEVWLAFRDE